MKVTFITGHLCKERHALLTELALDLGEYGAKVTVITGFPSRRIPDEIQRYYLDHPIEQISDNVVVRRIGSRKGEGKNLAQRMIKYIILTKAIYNEAKKTPTDVYYIYSSPPFLGYIGCKLAKLAPTLYNAQDLFPDTLVHLKKLSNANPLVAYLRKKEVKVYQKNTRIVTITQAMKKTISETGCSPEKIDVVNNWADTERLHHVTKTENALMVELGININKFIVSYAGDIGLFQGWDVIIDAAKKLQSLNPDISFIIIGGGSYKNRMETRIKEEHITNIRVFPLQPINRLSEIYSIGDMELVPIEKGIAKMSLPSKTGVIMAVGRPLLALVDEGSDIAMIINEKHTGIALENGSADNLVNTINYCYENQSELKKWGQNARLFAEQNYSRKIQTRKYYEILKSIVKS